MKALLRRLCVFVMMFFITTKAQDLQDSLNNCDDQDAALTTMEITTCTRTLETQSEVALKAAYQAVKAQLNGPHNNEDMAYSQAKEKLEIAQQAWESFRQNDCRARLLLNNGTIGPAMYLTCLSKYADERTEGLKRFMSE